MLPAISLLGRRRSAVQEEAERQGEEGRLEACAWLPAQNNAAPVGALGLEGARRGIGDRSSIP